ncbi:MAG TPA: gamma-glutamylcyclotransferase family protein [Vineibacter sp.]|nr:gamma-glutamylcyclotransferase family protein [Vineibacter sp.]
MNDVWYFAYGSNMDPARLKLRCTDKGAPVVERVGGHLAGWRLAFNKRRPNLPGEGAANVMEDPTGLVEGTLNRMPALGLDLLDVNEGVAQGQYARRSVRVRRIDTGAMVEAITYVALAAAVADDLRPSRGYLDHLLAGRDLLSAPYYDALAATVVID